MLDTARFPREVRLNIAHRNGARSTLSAIVDGVERDLSAVRAVWWRRPQPVELDAAMADADDRGFALGECHAALTGLWSCLDAQWMNHPERDELAARKAWQLKVAAGLGLRIPRTLITNDPVRAAEFIESEGPAASSTRRSRPRSAPGGKPACSAWRSAVCSTLSATPR